MKVIAYYLYNEEQIHETIRSTNVVIEIFKGDLKKFFPTCGKRYHTIYIEGCFNTKDNQKIIRECIRPAACLSGGEGLIFI